MIIPKKRKFVKSPNQCILTINGGSSSIKFAVYRSDETLRRQLYGKVDRIGLDGTNLTFNDLNQNENGCHVFEADDYPKATQILIDWLEKQVGFDSIKAVGHRVVHGMKHTDAEWITQELLEELHQVSPFAPDHLPGEIELIEAFRQRQPKLPQVACFDTAFHHTMPRVAQLLPIPRRFEALGVRRYGFHGLSYAYLIEELARVVGTKAARGRVIIAHLGNGASLAALRDGQSIDTSMGFTPAAGIPMGTRSGDLDPGVAWFMMLHDNLTPEQFNILINHQSGLLGVSETSSDMRDLLEREAGDVRAAEAVALFCYQVKKWVGSFAAVLSGLDTMVFSGGIGENSPIIRHRICDGLGFLGIELDQTRNEVNAGVISAENSRVPVRVIHTDEERMVASMVYQVIGETIRTGT